MILSAATSTYVPRSQGGRTYIISQPVLHLQETHIPCNWYDDVGKKLFADFSVGMYYNQSFKSSNIARCLFGSDTLVFSGSQVANRGARDILADNFGLAPDFEGRVTFKPQIRNFMVDLQYYLGLDDWCPGMFFRMELPLVHSQWAIKACSVQTSTSTNVLPALYMSENATAAVPTIPLALSGISTFGDMITTWNFSKFNFCRQSITRVADLTLMFGKNFLQSPTYHCGMYLNVVGPVGNNPDPEFFFSPIVGNGKFWELGVGLTAHVDCSHWCENTLAFYCEATMNTVLPHWQKRSFDFQNHGLLSRFMLLKQLAVDPETEELVYTGNLINAINFATRNARISAAIKVDATVLFNYTHGDHWAWSTGYNFFGKSKEKVCVACCSGPCDTIGNTYGIKGTEGGYTLVTTTTMALNSTQSAATIFAGAPVDNPEAIIGGVTWTGAQAYSSNPPITVDCFQLNPRSGGMPTQITSTLFSHVTHIWNHLDSKPYLTFGFEGEFATSHQCCSLNQWGFWLNGGLTF